MRNLRFTLAGMMGTVLVAAVGLSALKNASETWAGGMFMLTCGILALAVVGALYREGARRAWWLGFSILGWGYMALSGAWDESRLGKLPTTMVLEILGPRLGVPPQLNKWGAGPAVDRWFAQAGQCLWTLLAALIGGMLAFFFSASARDHPDRPSRDVHGTTPPPRSRWLSPTIVGLVVLISIAAAATIWPGSGASLWAGITFALTCALIGLAVLGALFDRGRRRQAWLGAALFGAGYAALIFSRPVGQPPRAYLATDQILKAMRPWFSSIPRSIDAASARILESLERPIPMQYPNEAPFEDVLNHIKKATSTPTYPGIPIYIDPIGLQEAERSLNSTVQIDLEGVPLRATLALCLKQLGLGYEVKDGYLRISGEDELSADLEDPFLIVGHCLLALLAAGFGAVAAPLVAGARHEPPGRNSSPVGDAHPT